MEESRRSAMAAAGAGRVPDAACSVDEFCPVPKNVGALERAASVTLGAAALLAGIERGGTSGLLLSGLGIAGIYRGLTGHCHGYEALGIDTASHPDATAVPAQQGVKFETSLRIEAPPQKVYTFWRNFENLPRVMRHVERVVMYGQGRSRWTARGPFGVRAEWNATLIGDRANEMVAWRSEPGSDVDTAGSVRFESLDGGRATELTVSLKYDPPGGKLAISISKLFAGGLEAEIEEDLRRFKREMESREASTPESTITERPEL